MGSLKSMKVYLSEQNDHTSDDCGDQGRAMDCCDDEYTLLKVKELSKQSDQSHLSLATFYSVPPIVTPPEFLHLLEEPFLPPIPDYMMPDPAGDLMVLNQVFRI